MNNDEQITRRDPRCPACWDESLWRRLWDAEIGWITHLAAIGENALATYLARCGPNWGVCSRHEGMLRSAQISRLARMGYTTIPIRNVPNTESLQ